MQLCSIKEKTSEDHQIDTNVKESRKEDNIASLKTPTRDVIIPQDLEPDDTSTTVATIEDKTSLISTENSLEICHTERDRDGNAESLDEKTPSPSNCLQPRSVVPVVIQYFIRLTSDPTHEDSRSRQSDID